MKYRNKLWVFIIFFLLFSVVNAFADETPSWFVDSIFYKHSSNQLDFTGYADEEWDLCDGISGGDYYDVWVLGRLSFPECTQDEIEHFDYQLIDTATQEQPISLCRVPYVQTPARIQDEYESAIRIGFHLFCSIENNPKEIVAQLIDGGLRLSIHSENTITVECKRENELNYIDCTQMGLYDNSTEKCNANIHVNTSIIHVSEEEAIQDPLYAWAIPYVIYNDYSCWHIKISISDQDTIYKSATVSSSKRNDIGILSDNSYCINGSESYTFDETGSLVISLVGAEKDFSIDDISHFLSDDEVRIYLSPEPLLYAYGYGEIADAWTIQVAPFDRLSQ